MAWITPRTWLVGEMVTAALMNAHLRDNLLALKNPPRDHLVTIASAFTTSSTTFVTITGAEVNVTTKGGRLLIGAFGTLGANTGLTAALSLLLDDTSRQGNSTLGLQRVYVPGSGFNGFGFAYLSFAMSAAPHNIKLQILTNTGVVSVPQWTLWMQET